MERQTKSEVLDLVEQLDYLIKTMPPVITAERKRKLYLIIDLLKTILNGGQVPVEKPKRIETPEQTSLF